MSGGDFSADLDLISSRLEELTVGGELIRIADWTLNSASWGVLKRIRAVWPVDTGLSYGKWGFERVGLMRYLVYNDAKNKKSKNYTGWVYAKGDRSRSPIAPGIVRRAILAERETIAKNFAARVERFTTR